MEKEPQPFATISVVYSPGRMLLSTYVEGVYNQQIKQNLDLQQASIGVIPPQRLFYELGQPGRDLESFNHISLNIPELPTISTDTKEGEVVMLLSDLLTQFANAAEAYVPESSLRRGDEGDKESLKMIRLLAQKTQTMWVKLMVKPTDDGMYTLSDTNPPQTIEP